MQAYQGVLAKVPGAKLTSKVYAANGMGIKPPEFPGAVTPTGKGSTKEEREAAKAEGEANGLLRERALVEAGDLAAQGIGPTGEQARKGGMSEATAAEQARRAFNKDTPDFYGIDAGQGKAAEAARTRVNARRGAIGYENAADAPGAKDALTERAQPYLDALEGSTNEQGKATAGLLSEAKKDKNGNVDPQQARKLTQEERDKFTDIFGRLAKKNDTMSPRTLSQIVYDIANPRADEIMGVGPKPDVDFKTGRVKYNGRTFVADDQTILELAAMRGEKAKQFFAAQTKVAVQRRDRDVKNEGIKTAAKEAAKNVDIKRLPATIRQIETSLSGYEEGLSKVKDPAARTEYENTIQNLRARRDAFRSRLQSLQSR